MIAMNILKHLAEEKGGPFLTAWDDLDQWQKVAAKKHSRITLYELECELQGRKPNPHVVLALVRDAQFAFERSVAVAGAWLEWLKAFRDEVEERMEASIECTCGERYCLVHGRFP